jgi:protein gp37
MSNLRNSTAIQIKGNFKGGKMSKLIKTGIPTADYGWNHIKGCSNTDCFLHPKNTGECWAAKMCKRMAGPWAEIESQYYPSFSVFKDDFGIVTRGDMEKAIKTKLKMFEPHFFKSQLQKKFPKKASMIAVGWMSDCSCWKPEWWRKTLDKIIADTLDRRSKGLKPHIFQFLTKKKAYEKRKFPQNCWLGFTAWDQESFDWHSITMYKHLVSHKNIIFAYIEPLLGKIEMGRNQLDFLDWVIVGGQSGHKAKPLNPDWIRGIRDQCQAAEIPFYFKGFGKFEQDLAWNTAKWKNVLHPKPQQRKKSMFWRPKFTSLDGEKWEQFPEVK